MAGIQHERTFLTARLDGDTLRVNLRGEASYADARTVTADLPVADGPEVEAARDALMAILDANRGAVEEATYKAAVECYSVAIRLGEI